ncbi:protein transport protein Sec16B isoform X2 [Dendropsophus ebraccatus]
MDHGPPHWYSQPHPGPPADLDPWRGGYPPPPPYHHIQGAYGYYLPYPVQGGHQAWPNPWMDYYSQYSANNSRHIDQRRPPSRAEVYERRLPLRAEVYERRPPSRAEVYGRRPPSRAEVYERRPPSRAEVYERRPPSRAEVYERRPPSRAEVYERRPPSRAEVYERRPPSRAEVYERRPPSRAEVYERRPPSRAEVYERRPPSRAEVYERRPPSRAEVYGRREAYHSLSRLRGYDDYSVQHPVERSCESAVDRLEYSSSTGHSLLSQYGDSGMSSSSYELSQYMQDPAALIYSWNPLQDDTLEQTPQPTAPLKFPLPHVTVAFGAQGQLIRVCPNFPDEGQPALVEIHSLEVLLHDTSEQEEMRGFPGPVQREDLHKVDVLNYCQQNVRQCLRSPGAHGHHNALLWQVLLQMCRQNGCIAGTDLADLLLQDYKRESYGGESGSLLVLGGEASLLPDGAQVDLLTGEVPSTQIASTRAKETFTKLLYFGRKKEALDLAMKNQLWGHALFLSSKMDSRTYSGVMTRFTSTLAVNDPLQTLFQLMAGRVPQAATSSGDKDWGDWRPHLAVMLSNQMSDSALNHRAIMTMGDNLVLKGLTEAGHCCYLTAAISLGSVSETSQRLILLGSNRNQRFKKFARTAIIQRTEILEYCQSLGKISHCIPSFQIYKFVYAARLVDYGLTSVALHYCECIARAILLSGSGSLVLISQLIKLAERLKYSDPQILEGTDPEQKQEPSWLVQLRALLIRLQVSNTSGRMTPVTCEEQGSRPEPENVSVRDEPYCGADLLNPDADPECAGCSAPPYTDPQSVQLQAAAMPGYRSDEEDRGGLEEMANNAGVMEALMSRRVSTVSEASTVSMDDDDGDEDRSGDEAHEAGEDKGSSFRWFSWFRSKPAKETAAPPRDVPKPFPQIKALMGRNPLQPPAPRPSYQRPPEASANSAYTGIKGAEDQQQISHVSPESRGQQERKGPDPNVPGSQTNPLSVPLYDPAQVMSPPSHLEQQPSITKNSSKILVKPQTSLAALHEDDIHLSTDDQRPRE